MDIPEASLLDRVQSLIARLVATSPAGEGLCLVGGLRYRLLDGSCRASVDIDYHFDGDLDTKRDQLLTLVRRKALLELHRRFGLEGAADPLVGPEADSPFVRSIALALFRLDVPGSRLEIPVDVTRLVHVDRPVVRTVGGTLHLTLSDADMVESKVIAIVQRVFVQHRDLLDLFLFQDALVADAGRRLRDKLSRLSVTRGAVEERLDRLRQSSDVHARGVDSVIEQQVDVPVAANLRQAGGGRMICERVLPVLERLLEDARG